MASREQTDAPNSWLAAIGHRLQLDRSLVFALAAKSWQALAGPITLMLVINAFPVSDRGVYYGLVNIIGIQAIFELGLLNVLISQAGNEAAKIAGRKNTKDIQFASSDELAAQRMNLLIRGSWQWFLMAAILFVIAGLLFGWLSLSAVETKLNWWLPLAVVIPIAGLSIALAPSMAILEGAGHRDSIYTFRLMQIVTGSMIVWLSLLAGFKLWTIVMAAAVQTLWMAYVIYIHHIDFFRRFRNLPQPSDGFSWSRDVVPMQWRVALISVAQYLASQLFVLVILGRDAAESATDAGRLGPTLTITTAIQMLALTWVQTKFSVVAAHHGAGERERAGVMWRHTALISTAMLCTALGALILLIVLLPMFGRGWEANFIQPWQLATLSIGFVANHLLALQSFYVMARRANPFWIPAVLGLLITAAAVWIFGRMYSTSGLVIAYAVATGAIALPLHSWAYIRFRREK